MHYTQGQYVTLPLATLAVVLIAYRLYSQHCKNSSGTGGRRAAVVQAVKGGGTGVGKKTGTGGKKNTNKTEHVPPTQQSHDTAVNSSHSEDSNSSSSGFCENECAFTSLAIAFALLFYFAVFHTVQLLL